MKLQQGNDQKPRGFAPPNVILTVQLESSLCSPPIGIGRGGVGRVLRGAGIGAADGEEAEAGASDASSVAVAVVPASVGGVMLKWGNNRSFFLQHF